MVLELFQKGTFLVLKQYQKAALGTETVPFGTESRGILEQLLQLETPPSLSKRFKI